MPEAGPEHPNGTPGIGLQSRLDVGQGYGLVMGTEEPLTHPDEGKQ